jgi:glycosyltransferase involved in cell wall biosynthesis
MIMRCLILETESNKTVLDQVSAISVRPMVVVGIPAFNEEMTIARVVLESQKYVDKVIVCDDGSSDLTGEIAERLGAIVVRHDQNLGYGAAVRTLFSKAKELDTDILVTLDADGQHLPNEIPHVIEPIEKGKADVSIGSRFVDERLAKTMPWYRRTGIKFIARLVNNSGSHRIRDVQSGFRAYNRKSLDALTVSENGMGVSVEILIQSKKNELRICEVSSTCKYDNDVKTSTHNPIKHLLTVVMSIIRLVVEDHPLTLLGLPGILSLALGTAFGIWMLQIYAMEHRIITNIALASVTFVLIGLFALFTAVTLYSISRLAKKSNEK